LDVYLTKATRCGLSANLECMSEMCCTPRAGNRPTERKNSLSAHHLTTLSGYIFATKARIDNRKKFVKQQYPATCSYNTVNFGTLTAEICWRVWCTPANFNGFRVLAALLHAVHGTPVVDVSQICGVEQRAPPIFGRAAITLGIGPHSSCSFSLHVPKIVVFFRCIQLVPFTVAHPV